MAFGYSRAIVDFTCYYYNAAVLLATLVGRHIRNGRRDFFLGSRKIATEGPSPKIIRVILNPNL